MKKRSLLPGLDQNTYETDTDSLDPDLRALTVSALAPVPGELLWDIGSGDGSIAIEWLRAIALASGGLTRTRAQAICFEAEPERVVNINRNANKLGVPWLKILGAAPKALKDARYATDPTAVAPDAIYLGAGLDQDMVMETAWSLLRPGGRMVVNARDTTGTKRLRVLQQQYGGTLRHIEITNDSDTVTVTQWRVHKPLVPTGV